MESRNGVGKGREEEAGETLDTPESWVETGAPRVAQAGRHGAGAEFLQVWSPRVSDPFLDQKTETGNWGGFAQETVAKLELGPWGPYVAAPHATHQPPLPRRRRFQYAAAHAAAQGATQPQPRGPEAGRLHAAPIHGPCPDVSHPPANRGRHLPPASNPRRAVGPPRS